LSILRASEFLSGSKLYVREAVTALSGHSIDKIATNKVGDDAVHFIVGIEHEPRKDGRWNFTRWTLSILRSSSLN
jgi:hypothetical protein